MSQDKPKVSVIIPVYNTEQYLRQCLDSVVNQTLRDIEIICVDDGSTDGSLSILKEYEQKDPRVTVLSVENGGVYVARNRGLALAGGEYLYFIDSDDYVELHLLEKTVKLADEFALDAVVFGVDQIAQANEGGWVHPASRRSADEPPVLLSGVEYIRRAKEEDTYVTTVWCMIWRRSVILDNGIRFREGMYYQDALFCLQAYQASAKLLLLADKLYHYRKRPKSITEKETTHHRTENFFLCVTGVLEYAFRKPHTPEEKWGIWQEYNRNVWEARRTYHALSVAEREIVSFPTELENEMFQQIVASREELDQARRDLDGIKNDLDRTRRELDQVKNDLRRTKRELDCVHRSVSYRIGRIVTWLPRKARGGVRCLRDNGLGYTFRRVLYHMGLWRDEG